jgi:hypothetical protein
VKGDKCASNSAGDKRENESRDQFSFERGGHGWRAPPITLSAIAYSSVSGVPA